MAESLTERIARLGAGGARATALGVVTAAVVVVAGVLAALGVDTVEVVATLLVAFVAGVTLYLGREPGFGAAALATGVYVLLRRPDMGAMGGASFAVLALTRAVAYGVVVYAGTWVRQAVGEAAPDGAADDRGLRQSPATVAAPVFVFDEDGVPEQVPVGAGVGGGTPWGAPAGGPGPAASAGPFGGPGGGRGDDPFAPRQDDDQRWDGEPHPSDWRVGPSALPPDDPESGPWTGPVPLQGDVGEPAPGAWPPPPGGPAHPDDGADGWDARPGDGAYPESGDGWAPAAGPDEWDDRGAAPGPWAPQGDDWRQQDEWAAQQQGAGGTDDRWAAQQGPGPDEWAAQAPDGTDDRWAAQRGPGGADDRWAPQQGPGPDEWAAQQQGPDAAGEWAGPQGAGDGDGRWYDEAPADPRYADPPPQQGQDAGWPPVAAPAPAAGTWPAAGAGPAPVHPPSGRWDAVPPGSDGGRHADPWASPSPDSGAVPVVDVGPDGHALGPDGRRGDFDAPEARSGDPATPPGPWEQIRPPTRSGTANLDQAAGVVGPMAAGAAAGALAGGPGAAPPGAGQPPAAPRPERSTMPPVDPETRLWSARYLCDRLASEQRQSVDRQVPFSLVLVQVPDGPLAALSYRRQVTLLRELGHQFVAGGVVDHLVHVPDQTQHWFAVVLPESDKATAEAFERRLRDGIGGYLRSRGLLLGELDSASLTSPDDDEAMGAIWEALIDRGDPSSAPEMAFDY